MQNTLSLFVNSWAADELVIVLAGEQQGGIRHLGGTYPTLPAERCSTVFSCGNGLEFSQQLAARLFIIRVIKREIFPEGCGIGYAPLPQFLWCAFQIKEGHGTPFSRRIPYLVTADDESVEGNAFHKTLPLAFCISRYGVDKATCEVPPGLQCHSFWQGNRRYDMAAPRGVGEVLPDSADNGRW